MHFPDLNSFDEFAYDTETTGLTHADRVFGVSISTPDGNDYYWDIRIIPDFVERLNNHLAQFKGVIVCHNVSFDYRMSTNTGIILPLNQMVDTCVNACLINEHEHSYSLDYLAKKYTNEHKKGDDLYKEMAAMFGGRATKNVQMRRIADAPDWMVAPYAKGDTRATLALHQWQKDEIKRQGLEDIVAFERELMPILIKTEMHGIRVDIEKAELAVGVLSEEIAKSQAELNAIAGFRVNPQPSSDIKKLFSPEWRDGRWWACDGTPLESTGTGNPSIGADALRSMSHPAAALILELRSLIKTRDTFLVGHVLESAINGRVYPTINQNKGEDGGTGTGRLSYSKPALQQIPDRNKRVAEIVKTVFLPEEGHEWVDMDMASFEVRIFAHLVGTSDICRKYEDDPETDFHQFVADLTGLVRNATYSGQPNAKQLNLSMIFNQGNGTTADEMGMPWEWESFIPSNSKDNKEVVYKKAGPEAMDVIDTYHRTLPGVKKLADGAKSTAEKRGYLFTKTGRHLRFPKGYKSYKASGILIQSTSADENKRNWLIINRVLKEMGGYLLLNTHDSYSLSLPIGKSEEICKAVKAAVEKDRGLRVPLILEVQKPGANWWLSKSSKRWM